MKTLRSLSAILFFVSTACAGQREPAADASTQEKSEDSAEEGEGESPKVQRKRADDYPGMW